MLNKKKILIIVAIVILIIIIVLLAIFVFKRIERNNRLNQLKATNERIAEAVTGGGKIISSQDAVSRKDYIGIQEEGDGRTYYKVTGYYQNTDWSGKIFIDINSNKDYEVNYDATTKFATQPANPYEDLNNVKTPETNPELYKYISLMDFVSKEKVMCLVRIKDNTIISMYKLLP